MTDKDIKDYCKNCSVEPPAMRFKCPECEHNPDKEKFAKDINVPRKVQINDSLKNSDKNFNENCTHEKEQIIIHGVDVSECKHLYSRWPGSLPKDTCAEYDYIDNPEDCGLINLCKTHPNCYYKQLQKEKFENLNNRQMVENAENLINENSELYKNLKEKEQECEELKDYAKRQENQRETYYKEFLKKDKALEEIEVAIETYSSKHQYSIANDLYNQILNIINKADFGKSEHSETRPGESCVEPVEPPIIQEAKGEG